MPPRSLTLAIVVFWLLVSGLFVYHDVWPFIRPSEPSLFSIELVAEAGPGRQIDSEGWGHVDWTTWTVWKNGDNVYVATTDWKYRPADDTFKSECVLWFKGDPVREGIRLGAGTLGLLPSPPELGPFLAASAVNPGVTAPERLRPDGEGRPIQFRNQFVKNSFCRINRAGQMEHFQSNTFFDIVLPAEDRSFSAAAVVEGAPTEGRFAPTVKVGLLSKPRPPGIAGDFPEDPEEFIAEAVPLSRRGLVLNPLHPLRRIPELHPGQRWQATAVDPLGGAAPLSLVGRKTGLSLGETGPGLRQVAYVLDARVRPETHVLVHDAKPTPCRVIECTGERAAVASLKVWARADDGLVLRQEAELRGDTWVFERRPFSGLYRPPPAVRPPEQQP